MRKSIAILLVFILCLSVLSLPAAAAGEPSVEAEPANTGDMFGVIIVALLVSALGVAILVFHKTRFVHD